jgi:plastocyanin
MKTRSGWIVGLLATLATLAACGEPEDERDSLAVDADAAMDTTPAGTPAPPSVDVITEDQQRQVAVRLVEWAVEISADTVPAGEITFQVMNSGTLNHAFEVEGQGVEEETPIVQPGGTATLTVTLEPGTYQLYCPVQAEYNHEQQGMTNTLVVTAATS